MLSKAAAKSTYEWWAELLQRPFYGITNDGKKREGLFQIQDESAPTEKVVSRVQEISPFDGTADLKQVAAAEAIICSLTEQEKAKAVFGLDDEAQLVAPPRTLEIC